MSRPRKVPSYRRHKSSGQAIFTLTDPSGQRRDVLLGKHGTAQSRKEYARVIEEWEASNRCLAPHSAEGSAQSDLSINELCLAYWRFAERYYVKDGKPTSEVFAVKQALRYVRQLYGHTQARDFGPIALKAVRQKLIEHRVVRMVKVTDPATGEVRQEEKLLHNGLARRNINKLIGRIKRMFSWAVGEQLLPPEVYAALGHVRGLRRGAGQGREKPRVKPVELSVVEATLPHLQPVVRAMVRVQLLSGMRPQEICAMRPAEIDMSGDVWEYRPSRFKTQHRHDDEPDQARVIFIGPKAQAILKPFLPSDKELYIFSPSRSEEARNAERRQERRSPMTPSQAKRKRKTSRRRGWGCCYITTSYRRCIRRACAKAGIPPWSPNQLRHRAATEVRKRFGLESAQSVLGHAEMNVTQIYAKTDHEMAARVMREIG
jgi:integrase